MTIPNATSPRILRERIPPQTPIGQCDACPPMQRLLPSAIIGKRWEQSPRITEIALDDQHRVMMTRDSASPVVINQAGIEALDRFAASRQIDPADPLTAEMIAAGLIAPENGHAAPIEITAALTVWLHITDRCNLRCAYCYLPHDPNDMTLETGRAAIEAAFRSAQRHGHPVIKIKYAGGEPLLKFQTILDLHQYAVWLGEAHNITVDGVVLSNGTLLDQHKARRLQTQGLRLMISLDGLANGHDIQRPYADGRGSFNEVSRALEIAQNEGLTPDISITVSGRNSEGLPALLQWVLNHDLPFSINFYRGNDLGSAADLRLEEEKILRAMSAAFETIEAHMPRRSILAGLLDRTNLAVPHQRPCGVGTNYLVFDPRGGLAQCQMQMNHTVGSIDSADPLAQVNSDQGGIQNLTVDSKIECRTCSWKNWCAGGCPLETYRSTGRYDLRSPNCTLYQALFPKALRLEGLRLLKYSEEKIID